MSNIPRLIIARWFYVMNNRLFSNISIHWFIGGRATQLVILMTRLNWCSNKRQFQRQASSSLPKPWFFFQINASWKEKKIKKFHRNVYLWWSYFLSSLSCPCLDRAMVFQLASFAFKHGATLAIIHENTTENAVKIESLTKRN